jgi:hypothetical protein
MSIQVERCAFCVEYGSNIKSISDTLLFKQVQLCIKRGLVMCQKRHSMCQKRPSYVSKET